MNAEIVIHWITLLPFNSWLEPPVINLNYSQVITEVIVPNPSGYKAKLSNKYPFGWRLYQELQLSDLLSLLTGINYNGN